MLSETRILDMIASGELQFPPIRFRLLESRVQRRDWVCDAVIKATWEEQEITFAAAVQRSSSDRSVQEAIRESRYAAERLDAMPLVITPWLSTEQLERLEAEGVSGIDLSGNGVIVVPGRILIVRSGKPNAYKDSRIVKNVYEGTSSLVARSFLLKPSYTSVMELLQEIQRRSGTITQSTVSKALKQLEADVVIWREKGLIKLLQADKLIERLASKFKLPTRLQEVTGKINAELAELPGILTSLANNAGGNVVVTGACSVNKYATMGRDPIIDVYCREDPTKLLKLPISQFEIGARFPNFRLIQTDDPTVFFDARLGGKTHWASPLQSYLELMKGDKRDKETAVEVRKYILKGSDLLSSGESA
jgi:DNA-binding MarR family transcriptional regulator